MMREGGRTLGMTIIATIVLIVLSVIYFTITLLIVKAAADIIFTEAISVDFAVLAAAIITLGSMIGGSFGGGGAFRS